MFEEVSNRSRCEDTDIFYLPFFAFRIPPFLAAVEDPRAAAMVNGKMVGCPVCGGLGHGIKDCPKLDSNIQRSMAGHSGRGGDGGGAY